MIDMRCQGQRHGAYVRRGASWRRMLLSQPPVVKVARVGSPQDRARRQRDGHMAVFEGGLTMGEFYDAVFAICWEGRRWWLDESQPGLRESFGAWVAWRVPLESTGRRHETVDDQGLAPLRWLAAADLVIGEAGSTWFHRVEDACNSHINGGCFMDQFSWMGRWTYQCEEYELGGRLWLPLSDEAPKSEDGDNNDDGNPA